MPILVIILFALVALSFVAFFVFFNRVFEKRDTGKMKQRLLERIPTEKPGASAQPLFRPEDKDQTGMANRVLAKLNLDGQLKDLIEQAGLRWSSGRTALAMLILGIGAFDAAWYTLPAFRTVAILPGFACGMMPVLYLWRKKTKRMIQFESQFPDALEFISRAMRAGHAFSVSLEMLHQEFSDPLGSEFRQTFDEQNLGLPMDVALEKLGQRIPMIDVHFFVSAVLLQKRTGGNLAEILDNLAGLIRERFKLRRQIRTISAQGRMSGMVLCLIPIAVGTIMFYVNPEHMRFFADDPAGTWMAGLAVFFQVLGFIVIRKIVNIEIF